MAFSYEKQNLKKGTNNMALFKRNLTMDKLLKAISALSPEDKEKVRAAIDESENKAAPDEAVKETEKGTPTATDEPSSGTDESDKENTETTGEETKSADSAGTNESTSSETSESVKSEAEETHDETVQDKEADEHGAEIIQALTDRVVALEERMQTLTALQERMEEYDTRNAEKFGYHGKPGDKRRDISEMSASELKEKILSGQH